MSKIKVNTSSLDATKQSIQAKLNTIQSNMDQLSGAMSRLNAMWSGDAYTATLNSVTNDLQFLQEVCKGLEKNVVKYEEKAVKEYNKCEQKVSSLISQISV